MLHLETATSADVLMLLGCFLGVGFMVSFLVALTLDGKKHDGKRHSERSEKPHYAAHASSIRTRDRAAVVNSASHLAIGVARITTALTWNPGGAPGETAAPQMQAAAAGNAAREVEVTAGRRYRSA